MAKRNGAHGQPGQAGPEDAAEDCQTPGGVGGKKRDRNSGGGMVTVEVNGSQELLSLKIEKEVVDPEDVEMLQDLILAAVNEGMKKAQEMVTSEMQKITGGMNIPGLF